MLSPKEASGAHSCSPGSYGCQQQCRASALWSPTLPTAQMLVVESAVTPDRLAAVADPGVGLGTVKVTLIAQPVCSSWTRMLGWPWMRWWRASPAENNRV